jgi:hypothetical protein
MSTSVTLPTPAAAVMPIGYYSLNIFLSTILFVVIFVTGSAWTEAAAQKIQGKKNAWKMMAFAGCITAATLIFSVGFGELSRLNPKINVDVQGLLTSSLAQTAPIVPLAPPGVTQSGASYSAGQPASSTFITAPRLLGAEAGSVHSKRLEDHSSADVYVAGNIRTYALPASSKPLTLEQEQRYAQVLMGGSV